MKRRTRINPMSQRRFEEQETYRERRIVFLTDRRRCEISWEHCTRDATDVHHRIARSQRRDLILDENNWVAACRTCHMQAEENPSRAFETGVSAHAWDAPESSKIVPRRQT